jgi:hypothetical protein
MALVKTGQIGSITVSPGWSAGWGGGKDFKPGQWFRWAVALDPADNPPQAWIQIAGETVDLQSDGNSTAGIILVNNFTQPVTVTANWLSVE